MKVAYDGDSYGGSFYGYKSTNSGSSYSSEGKNYMIRLTVEEASMTQRTFNANQSCTSGYLTFFSKAASLEGSDTCSYYYVDDNSIDNLILEYTNGDEDSYAYNSFEVCDTYGYADFASKIKIVADTDSDDDKCYLDDIEFLLNLDFNETEYQTIRGSGEMHVSDYVVGIENSLINISGSLVSVNTTLIAEEVWNSPNRNLTYYENFENFSAANVWEHENRTLTYYEPTDLSSLANLTATEVWIFPTRNLTNFGTLVTDIWEYVSRYTHGILLS